MKMVSNERLLLISGTAVLALLLVARAWMGSPDAAAKAAPEQKNLGKKQIASCRKKNLTRPRLFLKSKMVLGRKRGSVHLLGAGR
jgi:hypothetical protein